jgi:hypothetical protein
MTRSTSSDTQTAVAQNVTTPPLLIYMEWSSTLRIATWDTDITWNSQTWTKSGARGENINTAGGTLIVPNDTDFSVSPHVNFWLDRIAEDPLDRAIQIYQYNINKTVSPWVGAAEEIFNGIMDRAEVRVNGIRISLIESRQVKKFPPSSIEPPTYNWLLDVGDRLFWGDDIVTVN